MARCPAHRPSGFKNAPRYRLPCQFAARYLKQLPREGAYRFRILEANIGVDSVACMVSLLQGLIEAAPEEAIIFLRRDAQLLKTSHDTAMGSGQVTPLSCFRMSAFTANSAAL